MPYLDQYTTPLTAQTAAHLLRRATFGPRPEEIANFIGQTAEDAVNQLIFNSDYNLGEPVEYDQTMDSRGQQYLHIFADLSRDFIYWKYDKFWWIGQMAKQSSPPSILEKLTMFWQNHFVVNSETVKEYRYLFYYLKLLRDNALGSFSTMTIGITKDPAMLRYLNGNENVAGAPNENYGRELQELFTVGAKDFNGNPNYTENDIKAAARLLTGWTDNFGPFTYNSVFNYQLHDIGNKTFSSYYNNTTIVGENGLQAGEDEISELVTMLLNHPETPKFICRKLYQWFVNSNVTQDIETNIIIPLANIFKATNFSIQPVITKLLKSQHFFDVSNIGSMVKSPCDLLIGSLRFFNQPVPDANTVDVGSFFNYTNFLYTQLDSMQMSILQQPTVFGYEPYYQTGLSKVWINSTSLAQRSYFTDTLIDGTWVINNNYSVKIDLISYANEVMLVSPYDPFLVVQRFTKYLFATDLNTAQMNFLTDTIMMASIPRTTWNFEWTAYKASPTDVDKKAAVTSRLTNLMRYLLRMAEYQLF